MVTDESLHLVVWLPSVSVLGPPGIQSYLVRYGDVFDTGDCRCQEGPVIPSLKVLGSLATLDRLGKRFRPPSVAVDQKLWHRKFCRSSSSGTFQLVFLRSSGTYKSIHIYIYISLNLFLRAAFGVQNMSVCNTHEATRWRRNCSLDISYESRQSAVVGL